MEKYLYSPDHKQAYPYEKSQLKAPRMLKFAVNYLASKEVLADWFYAQSLEDARWSFFKINQDYIMIHPGMRVIDVASTPTHLFEQSLASIQREEDATVLFDHWLSINQNASSNELIAYLNQKSLDVETKPFTLFCFGFNKLTSILDQNIPLGRMNPQKQVFALDATDQVSVYDATLGFKSIAQKLAEMEFFLDDSQENWTMNFVHSGEGASLLMRDWSGTSMSLPMIAKDNPAQKPTLLVQNQPKLLITPAQSSPITPDIPQSDFLAQIDAVAEDQKHDSVHSEDELCVDFETSIPVIENDFKTPRDQPAPFGFSDNQLAEPITDESEPDHEKTEELDEKNEVYQEDQGQTGVENQVDQEPLKPTLPKPPLVTPKVPGGSNLIVKMGVATPAQPAETVSVNQENGDHQEPEAQSVNQLPEIGSSPAKQDLSKAINPGLKVIHRLHADEQTAPVKPPLLKN